jgi:hypothetical protein
LLVINSLADTELATVGENWMRTVSACPGSSENDPDPASTLNGAPRVPTLPVSGAVPVFLTCIVFTLVKGTPT